MNFKVRELISQEKVESRIREIARIIGGDIITETTLSSAKELIDFSQNLSKDLTLMQ